MLVNLDKDCHGSLNMNLVIHVLHKTINLLLEKYGFIIHLEYMNNMTIHRLCVVHHILGMDFELSHLQPIYYVVNFLY